MPMLRDPDDSPAVDARASQTVSEEPSAGRREALEHSRPIRWDRVIIGASGSSFLDSLTAVLTVSETRKKARRPKDAEAFRAVLQAVTADLFVAAKADPTLFLAYPRNNNDYRPTRYRDALITVTNVTVVADLLVSQGFAEGVPGFYRRVAFNETVAGTGRRARLRATPALVDLFEVAGVTPRAIGFSDLGEAIRLKGRAPTGKTKPLTEYDDDGETDAMRADLASINALLIDTMIDLEGDASEGDGAEQKEVERDDRSDMHDRSAIKLHRVFNGDWRSGGRFYGGWWMALGKDDRARLLIDGETTVELDFKAMHARLCYHLQGDQAPEGDPYALPEPPRLEREWVKGGFTRQLNSAAGKTPRDPFGLGTSRWRGVLRAIETTHGAIAGWFRAGRGLELQHVDATIASAVLIGLACRGIPCLPIHDSFIVPASQERALGEAMCLAYMAEVRRRGGAAAWPHISGWSSVAEVDVHRALESDPRPPSPQGFDEQGRVGVEGVGTAANLADTQYHN
jgi:hypothetical protein